MDRDDVRRAEQWIEATYGPLRAYRPRARGFVYFVLAGDRELVKIGWARNVEKRVAELQVGSPEELSVVLTLRGAPSLELELHERFFDLRLRGEWFTYRGELRRFVESPEHSE